MLPALIFWRMTYAKIIFKAGVLQWLKEANECINYTTENENATLTRVWQS